MLVVDGVEMLEVREAAALVQRTPETVRRWIWSGRVPATKRGNRLLVARRDLDALTDRGGSALTLGRWLRLVEDTVSPGKGSAVDLVLEDRRARGGDHARR